MNARIVLSLAALAALATAAQASAQSAGFRFEETPGNFPVGLQVVEQRDTSRAFAATPDDQKKSPDRAHARPIQTLVWYPALPGTAKPMTIGEYIALTKTETTLGNRDAVDQSAATYQGWISRMVTPSATTLWAQRDAKAAPGRFPVVIYAPSSSAVSWENADLCEYLASHGYVVIASPSMGSGDHDMPETVAGINEQARDISFLIDYARSLPHADTSEVAVAGWSWGGLAAVFAAARDKRIDAIVAFDGSFRYFPALVLASGDVHPERIAIPLLAFTQGNITLEQAAASLSGPESRGPNVLNAWQHDELLSVDMLGMSHPEFSSMVQRRKNDAQFLEDQKADYGREDVNVSYAWVALYTLRFVDAHLKHDAYAAAFLRHKPDANGVPAHVMNVTP